MPSRYTSAAAMHRRFRRAARESHNVVNYTSDGSVNELSSTDEEKENRLLVVCKNLRNFIRRLPESSEKNQTTDMNDTDEYTPRNVGVQTNPNFTDRASPQHALNMFFQHSGTDRESEIYRLIGRCKTLLFQKEDEYNIRQARSDLDPKIMEMINFGKNELEEIENKIRYRVSDEEWKINEYQYNYLRKQLRDLSHFLRKPDNFEI